MSASASVALAEALVIHHGATGATSKTDKRDDGDNESGPKADTRPYTEEAAHVELSDFAEAIRGVIKTVKNAELQSINEGDDTLGALLAIEILNAHMIARLAAA